MLRLPRGLRDDMVAAALAAHPLEACGVVAGPAGSDRPARFIPLHNAAASEVFYEVAPDDLLRLYQDLDKRGEEVVVVFHSHTRTAAYPSATDVELAAEPDAHYVLVSTQHIGRVPGQAPSLRSFRIRNGEIEEEDVALEG